MISFYSVFNKYYILQYSGWSVNNKDKYLAAQVTFKVQSRTETIVELHLDQHQQEVVKYAFSFCSFLYYHIVVSL